MKDKRQDIKPDIKPVTLAADRGESIGLMEPMPLHLRQTDERDRNSCVISWVNRRSRFLEKVEASNTLSSVESPTDQ